MFPTDLPITALQQLAKFFTKKDTDWGRFSLASWQIVGYGLGKAFPNTVLQLVGAPTDLNAIAATLPPDTMQKLANDQLVQASPELEALIITVSSKLIAYFLQRLGI